MTTIREGTRVRVHITFARRTEYASGCADVLHGLTGTVEEAKHHNYLGFEREAPYLVRFDDHDRPSWHTTGSKPLAFWFPEEDIEVLVDATSRLSDAGQLCAHD